MNQLSIAFTSANILYVALVNEEDGEIKLIDQAGHMAGRCWFHVSFEPEARVVVDCTEIDPAIKAQLCLDLAAEIQKRVRKHDDGPAYRFVL